MYAMFWVCMLRYGVASLRAKGLEEDGEYSKALFTNTHAAMAEDMYRVVSTLRGFWVKLGQYISTRSDIAPPVYTTKFKVFQDDNASAPFAEIKQTVEEELGCPLEQVFESFEVLTHTRKTHHIF